MNKKSQIFAIFVFVFKMPVFSKLTGDLSKLMGAMTENLREPMYAVRETAIKSGEPMLERMGQTIGKMMGGHFGKFFLSFCNKFYFQKL